MTVIYFASFVLLIGNSATDLFDYYGVQEMHGVNRTACVSRIAEGGTYIDGFANYNPYDSTFIELPTPFVFINRQALHGDHRDITLLNHELMHMSLLLHQWDVEHKEEDIITWAEIFTNLIYTDYLYEKN
jgi:hypothetical protein